MPPTLLEAFDGLSDVDQQITARLNESQREYEIALNHKPPASHCMLHAVLSLTVCLLRAVVVTPLDVAYYLSE